MNNHWHDWLKIVPVWSLLLAFTELVFIFVFISLHLTHSNCHQFLSFWHIFYWKYVILLLFWGLWGFNDSRGLMFCIYKQASSRKPCWWKQLILKEDWICCNFCYLKLTLIHKIKWFQKHPLQGILEIAPPKF